MAMFKNLRKGGQGSATAAGMEEEDDEPQTSTVRTNKVIGELVQGELTITVLAAKDLPVANKIAAVLQATRKKKKNFLSDPYVVVDTYFRGQKTSRLAKTSIMWQNLNPGWNETFHLLLCHEVDSLKFSVKDHARMKSNETLVSTWVTIEDILRKGKIGPEWMTLRNKKGVLQGKIQLQIKFTNAYGNKLPAYATPRGSILHSNCIIDYSSNEVPGVVYPMRHGCAFTPYQDAHTPAVPPITDVLVANGCHYKPPCLWVDILKALNAAESFIYIWGWAVWTGLELVRDGDDDNVEGSDETLGEVLKRKARDGVKVCIMIWDELASLNINPHGIMGTHDECTFNYFRHTTGVEVFKCPRTHEKPKEFGHRVFSRATFTHHQKGVLMDAPVGKDSNKRKVIGFMGGIDLTDGRYDTPEHPLFSTLKTTHKNDFYNGVTPTNTGDVGPRQPWHDIHCHVQGPIALDLLSNFEGRWKRQNLTEKLRALYPITEANGFDVGWLNNNDDDNNGSWNAQLFRTLDSDSISFSSSDLDKVNGTKGRLYENSIHRAYVYHIRRAKHFVYVESQYFIGSCHVWAEMETSNCTNLIPVEICARIEHAIAEGEDFRAFICVPLHPEGVPTSVAVQEILRYQYRTMEMMNRRIAAAIKKKGIVDATPTDYLYFFCLVKQESVKDVPASLALATPPTNSVAAKSRKSLRYMIYVHSKMAIFDDEYIIVGSANINDRSMKEHRDTEMAIGAYQPAFTKEAGDLGENLEGGAVRTFRLALWAEHCGAHLQEHVHPSSKECIRAMKKLGEENLSTYIADEPKKTKSHIISYPLNFKADGGVTTLDNCVDFPDTGGSIIGTKTSLLPKLLAT